MPAGGKVRAIQFVPTSPSTASTFSEVEPNDYPIAPPPFDPEPATSVASAAQPGGGGPTALATGERGTITIQIEDGNGTLLGDNDGYRVRIWWTFADQVVSRYDTEAFGPLGGLVAVATVVDPFDSTPATVSANDIYNAEEPINVVCPDLALGERFGYQFTTGSIVVSCTERLSFVIGENTAITAYKLDGSGASQYNISFSNLRIDDGGNFVFDITRDTTYEDELVIVITDLELQFDAGYLWTDEYVIAAGVSGSGVAGICEFGLWTLVEIEE